jgi:outer membrane protein assembly factor BamE (lipoprotein component of BamABCDE complex)
MGERAGLIGAWARRAAGAAALAATLAAGACAPVFRNHGYVPDEAALGAVVVGESTRDDVAAAVGRPSASGLLSDDAWYYVQSRYRLYGPREPKEIERQVLAVTFAEDGTVANVERFGLEDGRVVVLSRRVTETNIRGVSLITQLLRNLGQFRAEDIID